MVRPMEKIYTTGIFGTSKQTGVLSRTTRDDFSFNFQGFPEN
jgi:hypothetical protein